MTRSREDSQGQLRAQIMRKAHGNKAGLRSSQEFNTQVAPVRITKVRCRPVIAKQVHSDMVRSSKNQCQAQRLAHSQLRQEPEAQA